MFPEYLETDRLELHRLDDYVTPLDYYEVCAHDPGIDEVTEYMPWAPHDSPKETKEFLDEVTERWENGEGVDYALVETESGELAGCGGFGIDWDRKAASLGCWLRKPYWGNGYSGERADALIELAFETLDLDCVEVTHNAENEKSRRAIEKYVERNGGQRDGVARHALAYGDGSVSDEVRYTVLREEYEAARG